MFDKVLKAIALFLGGLKAIAPFLGGSTAQMNGGTPSTPFRGPIPSRKPRRRRPDNAAIRKNLGLTAGAPGNKFAVRAARRKLSLSVIR